jgi:hypothetical protein
MAGASVAADVQVMLKAKDRGLRKHSDVPERQVETSAMLAGERARDSVPRRGVPFERLWQAAGYPNSFQLGFHFQPESAASLTMSSPSSSNARAI